MLRWSTGLIAGALLAFAPLSADAETWKGYTFLPSVTHPAYKNFAQMGEEFAKVSDGRITVRTSAGGQLPINATAITQAVGDGIIHFAHDGFYSGNIPIGLLPFLPLLVNDWDDFQKVVAVIRPYLESELEKRGVKLLATYNFPQQSVWMTSNVATLGELSGKKLRVANAPQAQFFQLFDVTPVTLGSPEVASALQRGVVDGAITASAGGGLLWQESFKSNYRLTLNYDNFLVIVNKDTFEGLPPDLQKKIQDTAEKYATDLTKELAELEITSTEMLRGKGIAINMPSESDIAAARAKAEVVWNDWAKSVGPVAVDALAKARQAIAK